MKTLRPARFASGLSIALGLSISALTASSVQAAASFSTTDITWDVIGLDSNNVNVGPNDFPIGTRVCNNGDAVANGVTGTYVWDSVNPYINLRAGTASTLPVAPTVINLNPGQCTDFYYEVELTRDPAAYNTKRSYHIALSANAGATTGSTEVPREVYIEKIISQSRNYVRDMWIRPDGVGPFVNVAAGGTMTLLVGSIYEIRLDASTATNGYEQIETFVNFPNIIFQTLGVTTTYTAESSATMTPPYDMLYGDGCVWEDDPLNPNYRSCLSTGKAGGDITVIYRVQILTVPSAPLLNPEPLSTLVHDYSGSSYHYNSDFGSTTRYAYILDPATLDLTKSFVPSAITPGATSVLTIRIPNPTSGVLSGVNFIDPLPTSPAAMVVAPTPGAATSGCGTPTFAPTAGANTLQFSGGSIAAGTTCVITVNVTAPSAGTYTNTTGHLFINGTTPGTGTDTGNDATAVLTVGTNGTLCVAGQTMVEWTVPLTATNPPDTTGGVGSSVAGNVATATATAAVPARTGIATGLTTNGWETFGFKDAGQSMTFVVNTKNYTNVAVTWDWLNQSPSNGPCSTNGFPANCGSISSSAGGSVALTPPGNVWTAGPVVSALSTSTTGNTTFTINFNGAKNDNSGAGLVWDNIRFSGCSYAPPPQITKSFAPDPIVVGATSVLTFNITNPGNASYDAMALTGIAFSDTLPAGLLVATPNGLSGSCGGGTITATAGSSVISLAGASLATNASCSFSINVLGAAAGLHQNVSGFISATQSGTNTTSTGYATDTLLVIAPPVIAKAFAAETIAVGNSTSLSFTVSNPNVGTALTGVAFTDSLPAGLVVHNPNGLTGSCGGGTITAVAGSGSVSLSGATLAALTSCTFSLTVDGTTGGTKINTTSNVTSTNGGPGNTATATLIVTAPNPEISLLKQVGGSATGPWLSFLSTTAGAPVYYQLTIENTGDVTLSPVTVVDPQVNVFGCTWPASLAVGDTASCIVGPVTASAGSHLNTATAFGTYGSTTVTDTATATYSTNQLTLVKLVAEPYFNAAGVVLHYTYGVTNTGSVILTGPITVSDDKATVTCPPGNLGVGATMLCSATYTTVAADVTAGQVTNIATAHAASNAPPVSSNTATRTVPYTGAIDLAITKTDGVIRLETGSTTTYTIQVQNNGPSADGATVADPAVAGIVKNSLGACTASGGAVCPANLTIANLEAGTVLIPTFPNGSSISFTVNATITSRAAPLVPVVNVATVTKVTGVLAEFNLTNNTDNDPNLVAHTWGHLPAAYVNMNLFLQGGAYHLSGTTFLGAAKTTADDGINTVSYTSKPTDDGVTWTPSVAWSVAGGGSMDVTATCPGAPTNPCYLNAWIDFNADNVLSPGEQIFTNTALSVNGTHTYTLPFAITDDSHFDGTTLYARFRLTDGLVASPSPSGVSVNGSSIALVGEVEDPFFQIEDGVVTPVTVATFEAQRDGRSVEFTWTTASESGNVGFDIYVERGKRLEAVNKELIPSRSGDSLSRQHYSLRADVEGDTFYIEDVSIAGEARRHGPFSIGEVYGSEVEDEKVAWASIREEHAALRAGAGSPSLLAMGRSPGSQTVRIEVRQSGIQRVTYESLVAAGVVPGTSMDRLYLSHRGQAVGIYSATRRFGPGEAFEFYGEALETIYTDTNVYELQIGGRGSAPVGEVNAAPAAVPVLASSFTDTFVLDRQLAYANYAPSSDAWYDTYMLAFTTPQTWTVPFVLDGLASSTAPATAELVAWGVTDWGQTPDHHLVAGLNGVGVVDQMFDGLVEKRWTASIPAGTLANGANRLDLTLPGDTGAGWDVVNFDKLRITYERSFQARGGRLAFTATGQDFRVTNLPSNNVVVYRLDNQGLKRLTGLRVENQGATWRVTFAGSRRSSTYFVSAAGSLPAPGVARVPGVVDLDVEADYLVISHPAFIAGLAPLIAAREAQGLSVNVVDVNDIYAQYSFGVVDPLAIRAYIAHASAELGTEAVLLVGGDTYDYRNYLGVGSISFIPSLYASTGQFVRFVPSDTLYVDFEAANVPSLAIGRFPVRTTAELDLLVAKTLQYNEKDYGRTAFFAADRTDGGVSFKGINAGFVARLPAGWLSESVNLDDASTVTAQNDLIAAMNRGTAMVTYTGHSGPREWSFSHLFTNAHAAALTNAGRPFVAVQWGCWNTYYVDPVNAYLVQSFLFSGDRGAAAVLGAATLTDSSSEAMLGELLTPRLAIPGMTLGRALTEAKQELGALYPELVDVLLGWSLMGDPALTIEP